MKMLNKTKKIDLSISDEHLKVHPALKGFFGYSLFKAGIHYRALMEKTSSKWELSAPQCGILYILNNGEEINQLSLGQELGIDKATMVKNIDKLEKLKLVKRTTDANDRRAKLLSLTEKGKKSVEEVRSSRNKQEERIFSQFSKKDEEILRKLIPELLEAIMRIENEEQEAV
jgi:DNA-binding MarR family transcriptional regulator